MTEATQPRGTADLAASEIANAGHRLYRILRDAMTDGEREETDLLVTSGAELCMTAKWSAEGIEVAVGLVPGDGPGLVLEVFKTPRPAAETAH